MEHEYRVFFKKVEVHGDDYLVEYSYNIILSMIPVILNIAYTAGCRICHLRSRRMQIQNKMQELTSREVCMISPGSDQELTSREIHKLVEIARSLAHIHTNGYNPLDILSATSVGIKLLSPLFMQLFWKLTRYVRGYVQKCVDNGKDVNLQIVINAKTIISGLRYSLATRN
nr:RNA polymerase II second largest subunit [Tanacetum cinerariifolium]